MSLTVTEVQHIASLSRIELTHEQATSMASELTRIFALIEKIQAIDTTHVKPLAHPSPADSAPPLFLREDISRAALARHHYQDEAPLTQEGLYLVPRVIE